MNNLLKATQLLCFFLFINTAAANDNFQFSGFGTLGVVLSDSDTHGYRRNVSLDYGVFSGDVDFKNNTLLGLQLDSKLTEHIDFTGQVVLRDLPDNSLKNYLTQANFRFHATPNWTFRVGRTSPDLFLMTEYRDIDFSYPWATPPNEIYSIIPNHYIDGLDVTYSTKLKSATLSTKLFTGVSEAKVASTVVTESIKLEDIYGLSITYDDFLWAIQAKFSQVSIAEEIQSGQLITQQLEFVPDLIWPNAIEFADNLSLKNEKLFYSSINGQFSWSQWQLSFELARINSDSTIVPKIGSAYAGASYQLQSHQLFSLIAFTHAHNYTFDENNVVEEAIPELITAIDETLNFYTSNQRTFTLGWRWDISSSVASTIQWNHTKIDAKGSTLWWTPGADLNDESVNTLMFNLSFVF